MSGRQNRHSTRLPTVPAHKTLTRILPAAAVAAGLLFAAPAADAAHGKGKKTSKQTVVKATIALGDKRPARLRAHAAKSKKRKTPTARIAQLAPCQNTDLMPTAANVELVRAAILCLHNQIRAAQGLPLLRDNAKLRKAAT